VNDAEDLRTDRNAAQQQDSDRRDVESVRYDNEQDAEKNGTRKRHDSCWFEVGHCGLDVLSP
jgi:hypothetical protein